MVVESDGTRKNIAIYSRDNAPVIAVNDGKVTNLGETKRLGKFIQVQDVYGNTYTYAHLGSVAKTYPAPKPRSVGKNEVRRELHLVKPKQAASTTAKAAKAPAAPAKERLAANGSTSVAATTPPAPAPKQRLFAHPNRPNARVAGGAEQLGEVATSASAPLGFNAKDFTPKKLKK